MPIPVTFPDGDGKGFSDFSLKQIVSAFTAGKGRFRSDNSVTAVGFDIVRFVSSKHTCCPLEYLENDPIRLDQSLRSEAYNYTENRANMEYILYYQSAGSDSAKRVLVDANGLHKDVSFEPWEFFFQTSCLAYLPFLSAMHNSRTCRFGKNSMSKRKVDPDGSPRSRCLLRTHSSAPRLEGQLSCATEKR